MDGNNRKLGRRTKRAIGLSSEAPDRLGKPLGRNTITDFVHFPGAIAMRDDTGIRHAVTERVLALFYIARVDTGCSNTNADFSGRGVRIRHFSDSHYFSPWTFSSRTTLLPSDPH